MRREEYFKAFDLIVVPSRYEGFPYVYLEAMASHTPVLASDVAGTDEIIVKYGMGVSFENSDSDVAVSKYAAEIVRLFDDRGSLEKMSLNARAIGETFSTRRMLRDLLAVYSSS